jgi:DNA polymerase (family 10)
MLHHFTGSKEHSIQLRDYALSQGISINDYGLQEVKTGEVYRCAEEEEVYHRLKMDWIPPEIRQGTDEIEAALAHRLPRLVELSDLKGDLHAHTTYSDGANTIKEMALAARELGYEYLAITDHSQSRGHAGGLSIERIQEQAEEVKQVNAEVSGITLLHGTEVDIKRDGSLDFPDELLMSLDIVVASIHSALRQDREATTARLVKAARHPAVTIIGHPTGRLLCQREASDVDLEALFQACAETGTALEVSSVPNRLDLEGTHARRARDLGVMLSLDTDSHRAAHLSRWRPFGLGQARRGWLRAEDVLNTRSLDEIKKFVQQKRGRRV